MFTEACPAAVETRPLPRVTAQLMLYHSHSIMQPSPLPRRHQSSPPNTPPQLYDDNHHAQFHQRGDPSTLALWRVQRFHARVCVSTCYFASKWCCQHCAPWFRFFFCPSCDRNRLGRIVVINFVPHICDWMRWVRCVRACENAERILRNLRLPAPSRNYSLTCAPRVRACSVLTGYGKN